MRDGWMIGRIRKHIRKFLNKNKLLRLLLIIIIIWLIGASLLLMTEGLRNSDFDSLGKSLWNIAIYLFSGLDSGVPTTVVGRVIVTVILIVSLGIVGVFTATLASIMVERRLGGKRMIPKQGLKDHIVICNWNEKGLAIIREAHAAIIEDRRPIVIISESADSIQLPDDEDAPEFEDVYLVQGDPTNQVILKRAGVHRAYSAIILVQAEEQDIADSKSILICMAIKGICAEQSTEKTYITVEGVATRYIDHLRKVGADEIISANDFTTLLLSQSALVHGLSDVYRNLLTVSEETNEIYLVPVTDEFVGRTFTELGVQILENRRDENPVVLIGVKTDGMIYVNPRSHEFERLKSGDEAIVIAFERPKALV
jgi:voltage-gated potassium channel